MSAVSAAGTCDEYGRIDYPDGTCGPALVICRPPRLIRRFVGWCPVCQRNRRFVEHFGGLYYDPWQTCCGCGDSWCAGELGERPFQRGWRKRAIAKARQDWAEAVSPRVYRAAIRAELRAHTADLAAAS